MTALEPEALRVAGLVIEVLERHGIPYHLGGSYASALHGVPRQTHDIDLVIDPVPGSERALAESLHDRFYADVASIARAMRERSSCNLIHFDTGIKVDLFVKGRTPFDQSEFDRRVSVPLEGAVPAAVFVKSPEDTILRKLLWYRLGGKVSERQLEDARGIVGVQAERLDRSYLSRWATALEIQDLLAEILRGD
ncbi:MAG TPA: hypothetical protein VFV75_21065 [Candidatus Polarisedimenticolaceae bacterium]|nr:hypothetical protein [Candidatus Polarisedimenticolaceae bacterium]